MATGLPPAVADVVAELIAGNPSVVWLAGSYARGDQARFSDVDLGVLADGASPRLARWARSGVLISVSYTTVGLARASFRQPMLAGAAIPGWRAAAILHDPSGIGANVQARARSWTWEEIANETDETLNHEAGVVVDLVLKVLNGLQRGNPAEAARQKNALVATLIRLVAVHRRLLYDSEAHLIAAVNGAMGEEWARLTDVALGVRDGNGPTRAAIEMALRAFSEMEPGLGKEAAQFAQLARSSIDWQANYSRATEARPATREARSCDRASSHKH